jgi:hypothetical protein
MAPQEPDKAGLAALLQQRATHWPMEDMGRVVDERRPAGYPMAPMVHTGDPLEPMVPADFVGPDRLGSLPQPQRHVLPQPDMMRPSTRDSMVAPEDPLSEDMYWGLMQRLWQGAHQPGRIR